MTNEYVLIDVLPNKYSAYELYKNASG